MAFRPNIGVKENKNFGSLSQSQLETYIASMERFMKKDKVYLDENLNLREFASLLNLDPNLVSFILNEHIKSNFHDFVNKYRIEEVKSQLYNPAKNNITLLGIALDSGFNSKTTFNRVFKKMTGSTPSEFRKNIESSTKK
ncbi:hypothetical protein GCM10022397_19990 [Flavivirga jejuensis]